ncbi:unnamed protein product [Cylindrotheca closterium]|uniref:DUF6824 domain-containing protein n=1 Tax=Cylindrotheca closterium TaxID=2856 RepID=A0AAD2JGL6_9STRA|nr:unnamed protein product [Cylindrotheca closterium]
MEESAADGNKEATKSSSDVSDQPTPVQRTANDILCGRGVPILNYHGNIRLHNIIDSYRGSYLKSDRKEKPVLVRQIVREIKAGGARFLKRSSGNDSDSWVEVSDSYAHEKVSHALRCKKAAAKSGSTSTSASAIKASLAGPSSGGAQVQQPQEAPPNIFQTMQLSSAFPSLRGSFQQPFQQSQLQYRQNPFAYALPPSLLAIDPSIERTNALSRLTSPRLELASQMEAARNPFAYLNSNMNSNVPSFGYENIFPPNPALAGLTRSTVDSLSTSIRQQRELLQRQMLFAQALPSTAQTSANTPNEQMQALQRLRQAHALGQNPIVPTQQGLVHTISRKDTTADGSPGKDKVKGAK